MITSLTGNSSRNLPLGILAHSHIRQHTIIQAPVLETGLCTVATKLRLLESLCIAIHNKGLTPKVHGGWHELSALLKHTDKLANIG